MMKEFPPYHARELVNTDLDAVCALYNEVYAGTPYGFLAYKQRADFERLLEQQKGSVCVGIFDHKTLTGYALCKIVEKPPFPGVALLMKLFDAKKCVYQGQGLVVSQHYRRRRIARRLCRTLVDLLATRNIDHMVSLIDVRNLASVATHLSAGARLIGFEYDETSYNYVVLHSSRVFRNTLNEPLKVKIECKEKQLQLFEGGWCVTSMKEAGKESYLCFSEFMQNDSRQASEA